jgi:hypothetical protein
MVEKADDWGMPLSQFKETHTRQDLYTLLALRILQNEENDVFVDDETKKKRKGQLAQLNRKRESILADMEIKSDLTEHELNDFRTKAKMKRQRQMAKMEENRRKFQERQKNSVSMKNKPNT